MSSPSLHRYPAAGPFVAVLALMLMSVPAAYASPEAPEWEFLSTTAIGAADFIATHPEFDGRGTVLAVMDTGVDMGIPGLTEGPDGSVKVVDVRDFTGQGDVRLEQAEWQDNTSGVEGGDRFLTVEGTGIVLWGAETLPHQPLEEDGWLVGALEEKDSVNSAVPDLNNDGDTGDRFAVAVFRTAGDEGAEPFWAACVDTDGDGRLDDETVIRDYHVAFDSFQLRGRDPQERKNLLTMALNIYPDEQRVCFHFDDGAHGSHVAGIAAGYRLNGQEGYNGIAPGARVISLKIGNNTLSGGASTTDSFRRALEYGIEYAEAHDVPVIFNLSYGVGSDPVARNDADRVLEEILAGNEDRVLLLTSMGNSGPGINSVGAPAGAPGLFTVGAMLNRSTARDAFGANIAADQVSSYSSRGGLADKPDVIAPGTSCSTVPPFETHDRYSGTSMATPQAAGAALLLAGAAARTWPDRPLKGALLGRAMKAGAQPLPGYTRIDQGAGVVNLTGAWNALRYLMEGNEDLMLLGYRVETFSPAYEDEKGPAGYWRYGSALPDTAREQGFTISPIFPEAADADQRQNFYRAFNLVSSAPWLRPGKSSIYIRGENEATVTLRIDPSELKGSGLHCATVSALRKDGHRDLVEFTMVVTVIKPLTPGPADNHTCRLQRANVAAGDVQRQFIQVPIGATAMRLHAAIPEGRYGNVRIHAYNQQGYRIWRSPWLNSETSRREASLFLSGPDLTPGTWEIDLVTSFRAVKASSCDVDVSFTGFLPSTPAPWKPALQAGENPAGTFQLTTSLDTSFHGSASGTVEGFTRTRRVETDGDTFEHRFKLNGRLAEVRFRLTMPPGQFGRFTDLAANVLDQSGKAVLRDGMTYPFWTATFRNPAPDEAGAREYTLQLAGGFADSAAGTTWEFELREDYVWKDRVPVTVKRDHRETFSLYPGIEAELAYELQGEPVVAPSGYGHFGVIRMIDDATGEEVDRIPVHWDFRP